MYKYVAKHSSELKNTVFKTFNLNRLRLMTFNELNLLTTEKETEKLFRKVEKLYEEFFEKALEEFDLSPQFIKKNLDQYNETMMYVFLNEVERKKMRYMESVNGASAVGTSPLNAFNDIRFVQNMTSTARNLSNQIIEETVDLERKAELERLEKDGVKQVMWVTAGDERVCEECGPLDGEIFDIDKLPPRPHRNCRCEFVKVNGETE